MNRNKSLQLVARKKHKTRNNIFKMKTKLSLKSTAWMSLLIVTILWSACDPTIMNIAQPPFTEINSSFSTSINIFRDEFIRLPDKGGTVMPSGFEVYLPQELIDQMQPEKSRGGHVLYFGIMLPQGWTVSDSISFRGDMEGKFIHSDKRTREMQNIDPARHGFYWWVGETIPPVPLSCGCLHCFPEISTDDQTGDFHIDYMLGYYDGQPLLNTCRVNNQYINIGTEDTVWVTSSEEYGQGSIREAIDIVRPGGLILFDLPRNTTINISEQIWIYKDVVIDNQDQNSLWITSENNCRLLYIENNADVGISGIRLERGTADLGGGIYCGENSKVSLQNMIIRNNSAYQGGGIFCADHSKIKLVNSEFIQNKAFRKGGAVYCSYSILDFSKVKITNNHAGFKGGGIYSVKSHSTIINSLIVQNEAIVKGGGIYLFQSLSTINNVTMASNTAYYAGSGIYFSKGSRASLINCIMWNDFPDEICFSPGNLANTITISYSDIDGDSAGVITNNNGTLNWMDGNLAENPVFCGFGENPCALFAGSPCIDTGTPDTTGLNLPPFDIIGHDRIQDGDGDGVAVVDMGAYEFEGRYGGEGVLQVEGLQVTGYKLQVFPNPTCGISYIKYTSPLTSHISQVTYQVELAIFNINGNKIQTLVDKKQSSGEYTIQFNASTLPAGIYLVRLQAGEVIKTVKVVVR